MKKHKLLIVLLGFSINSFGSGKFGWTDAGGNRPSNNKSAAEAVALGLAGYVWPNTWCGSWPKNGDTENPPDKSTWEARQQNYWCYEYWDGCFPENVGDKCFWKESDLVKPVGICIKDEVFSNNPPNVSGTDKYYCSHTQHTQKAVNLAVNKITDTAKEVAVGAASAAAGGG